MKNWDPRPWCFYRASVTVTLRAMKGFPVEEAKSLKESV